MLSININSLARHIYLQAFYILGIIGLLTYGADARYIPVTPQTIFEVIVVLIAILGLTRFDLLRGGALFYIVFMYVFSSYFLVLARGEVGFADFIMAYKAYIYVLIAACFSYFKFLSRQDVHRLFNFLLFVFFVKYLVSVLFAIDYRPVVYRENNYELMFLALLFYFHCIYVRRPSLLMISIVTAIFLLSGSRSAVALYAVVVVAINLEGMKLKRFLILLVSTLVMLMILYFIFMSRLGDDGLDSIDRLWFFGFFQHETDGWGYLNYLFGAERITRMSDFTCHSLRFYENLVSFHDPYICYSVILHSFVMRAIFDHGIIFSVLLVCFIYYLLRLSGHALFPSLVFIFVVILNGFSVSSFNSVFYMLALVLFLCVPATQLKRDDVKV